MNWEQIKGNWKQFTGQAKQQWGKLTDDDLAVINGKREELSGRIQERYGYAKEEAETEISRMASSLRMLPCVLSKALHTNKLPKSKVHLEPSSREITTRRVVRRSPNRQLNCLQRPILSLYRT